jgi:hypothetical protein
VRKTVEFFDDGKISSEQTKGEGTAKKDTITRNCKNHRVYVVESSRTCIPCHRNGCSRMGQFMEIVEGQVVARYFSDFIRKKRKKKNKSAHSTARKGPIQTKSRKNFRYETEVAKLDTDCKRDCLPLITLTWEPSDAK